MKPTQPTPPPTSDNGPSKQDEILNAIYTILLFIIAFGGIIILVVLK